jgi:hypothetical protein
MNLADLIIESVIRDGLEYLRRNPDVVDDIFGTLTMAYASRKYGSAELTKIKNLLTTKNIAVVHSFHEAAAKTPCYSIQLANEAEAKERAHLGDFEADVQVNILGDSTLIRVPSFTPTSYATQSGKIAVPDGVDLDPIGPGFIFVDASNNSFTVQPGISNDLGNKFFFIGTGLQPNLGAGCYIKTFLDFTQHEVKGDTSQVNIIIGVHSKDALLTKYLYVILKYILKSRKSDLIKRNFINSTFQGSDFTRDLKYEGDIVFTRFFTAMGQVDDSWVSDNVQLIDLIEVDAQPDDEPADEVDDQTVDDED